MNNENMKSKSNGGKARAKNMSAEQLSESAKKAVAARIEKSKLPTAINEGILPIDGIALDVAVLPDGKRVISQTSVFEALNRTQRGFKAITDSNQRMFGEIRVPPFMDAKNLLPFINEELFEAMQKITYKSKSGMVREGYDAIILPLVCDLYLKANDGKVITTRQQQEIVKKAEMLVRSLAKVGIIALVDEATGYQRDRKRDALAAILEKFISKEMRPWLKTFQLDFYEELCRVWGYQMPQKPGAYPPVFAHVIRDIVYDRLAPGVRKQLQEMKKTRGGKMHQWLTGHAGYNELTRHLGEVTMLLRLTPDGDKDKFYEMLNNFKPVLTIDTLIDATK